MAAMTRWPARSGRADRSCDEARAFDGAEGGRGTVPGASKEIQTCVPHCHFAEDRVCPLRNVFASKTLSRRVAPKPGGAVSGIRPCALARRPRRQRRFQSSQGYPLVINPLWARTTLGPKPTEEIPTRHSPRKLPARSLQQQQGAGPPHRAGNAHRRRRRR